MNCDISSFCILICYLVYYFLLLGNNSVAAIMLMKSPGKCKDFNVISLLPATTPSLLQLCPHCSPLYYGQQHKIQITSDPVIGIFNCFSSYCCHWRLKAFHGWQPWSSPHLQTPGKVIVPFSAFCKLMKLSQTIAIEKTYAAVWVLLVLIQVFSFIEAISEVSATVHEKHDRLCI